MSHDKHEVFLNRFAAISERLHRIGIHPFGYDPGYLCDVDGQNGCLDLTENLARILSDTIKKAYPETVDDKAMIQAYRERMKDKVRRK